MSKRLEYSYVKAQIESTGYTLLSDTYKSTETNLKLRCPEGHEFEAPFHRFHDAGTRCPICNNLNGFRNSKNTYENVKAKFESEGYKLISTEYKNNRQKLDVICPEGHIYKISCHGFFRGQRCKKCGDANKGLNRRLKYNDVKDMLENEGYKLVTNYYDNIYQKLDVVCPNGHNWSVSVANFKHNNCRCAKCPNRTSKPEKEVFYFVQSLFPLAASSDRSIISPLELDIVVDEKKLAIEFAGLYWHSEANTKRNKEYHLYKLEKCIENSYKLLTIFEDEWLYKKEIVKNIILENLGVNVCKCCKKFNIYNIGKEDYVDFLNKNSIFSCYNETIYIGLFNNNKLKSVAGFYELWNNVFVLSNFTGKHNIKHIVDYFIYKYKPKSIIYNSDRRYSEGEFMIDLGFIHKCNTKPNYYYTYNLVRTKTKPANHNFRKIWDCGCSVWVKLCD